MKSITGQDPHIFIHKLPVTNHIILDQDLFKDLTGKKHREIKLQRLPKVRI